MIRVLIADDFPQMIQVLEKLIGAAEDMAVASAITDFRTVQERIADIEFDVILMNDYLPPTNSVSASRRLRELGLETPIVVMSMQRDAGLIRDSLAAGANGFILKGEFMQHLLPAIRTVYSGEQYLSPDATTVLASKE